jgi:hypothetical protein
MIKTGDSNRRLGIVLMVLAVLVVGITATGYADPPTEQLSGPALVGTLEELPNGTFTFNGQCTGDREVTFTATPTTTQEGLLGLRLSIIQTVCRHQPSSVVIVKNVINNGSTTAKVVLLWVVSQ